MPDKLLQLCRAKLEFTKQTALVPGEVGCDDVVRVCSGLPELAAKFRGVAAIEKSHEERYRKLLKNVETAQVFERSEVKVWECRNCGHIVVGTKAPDECPVCAHARSYFELRAENY